MKIYLVIFTICFLASCSKDLLKEDPKVPTGTQFYTNANDLSLAATG